MKFPTKNKMDVYMYVPPREELGVSKIAIFKILKFTAIGKQCFKKYWLY